MDTSPSLKTVFSGEISILPPSTNKMYVYTRHGPVPSKEMKKFKAMASLELVRQIPFNVEPPDPNKPYRLNLHYYLPALFNKGWPKKAKTRFKRRDVSNLIKVLEDLVSWSLGIDDSCFIEVFSRKYNGPDHDFEGVRVEVQEILDGNKAT